MPSSATIAGALLITALGVGVTSCAKSQPADEAAPAVQPNVSSWFDVRIYPSEWTNTVLHSLFAMRGVPDCDFLVLKSVEAEGLVNLRYAAFALGGDAVIEAAEAFK
jgi:hypothetical protein